MVEKARHPLTMPHTIWHGGHMVYTSKSPYGSIVLISSPLPYSFVPHPISADSSPDGMG